MSWLSEIFMGKDASTKQYSTLDPNQQKVAGQIGTQIAKGLTSGATPYSGQLVASMPSMFSEAFKTLSGTMGQYNDLIKQSLVGQAAGVPAYTFDSGKASETWNKTYAIPVMQTWRETVLPMISESYNALPGMAYSAARGKGIEGAANQYYTENVAPSLYNWLQTGEQMGFQSAENAAARQLSAASQLGSYDYGQFMNAAGASSMVQSAEQQELTAKYNEFLRTTAEGNPWLAQAMSYIGTPTTATVYSPETTGMGKQWLAGILGNLGPTSTGGGGLGNLITSLATMGA